MSSARKPAGGPRERKKNGAAHKKQAAVSPRSTAATVEQRVTEVVRLLLEGKRPAEILAYSSAVGWDVSERTIDNYIAKAMVEIRTIQEGMREDAFEVQAARVLHLYNISLEMKSEKGALATALGALKELNAMYGVRAPTKIAPTTPDGEESYQVDPLELLRSRLAKLAPAE